MLPFVGTCVIIALSKRNDDDHEEVHSLVHAEHR